MLGASCLGSKRPVRVSVLDAFTNTVCALCGVFEKEGMLIALKHVRVWFWI